jgi:predicted aspartyl protease
MNNIDYTHTSGFELLENKMIIELQSVDYRNRKEPIQWLNLLIDTGAFVTMLNKATAEENGYPVIKEKGCRISGFSQKDLLCDLRKIPTLIFCGYSINDVILATPHYENARVSEVLGMNVLENFDFEFNLTKREVYLNKRNFFISEKPRYKSGEVNLFVEDTQKPY